MGEDTKQIGIRIPISIYQELKLIAHNRGLSFTDIAVESFLEYLNTNTPGLCPSCHTQNPPDAKFCLSCGTALGEIISPEDISRIFLDLNKLSDRVHDMETSMAKLKKEKEDKNSTETV